MSESGRRLPPTPAEVRRYFAERDQGHWSQGYTEEQLARNEELWKSILGVPEGAKTESNSSGTGSRSSVPVRLTEGEKSAGGEKTFDRRSYQRELMRRRRAAKRNKKG